MCIRDSVWTYEYADSVEPIYRVVGVRGDLDDEVFFVLAQGLSSIPADSLLLKLNYDGEPVWSQKLSDYKLAEPELNIRDMAVYPDKSHVVVNVEGETTSGITEQFTTMAHLSNIDGSIDFSYTLDANFLVTSFDMNAASTHIFIAMSAGPTASRSQSQGIWYYADVSSGAPNLGAAVSGTTGYRDSTGALSPSGNAVNFFSARYASSNTFIVGMEQAADESLFSYAFIDVTASSGDTWVQLDITGTGCSGLEYAPCVEKVSFPLYDTDNVFFGTH